MVVSIKEAVPPLTFKYYLHVIWHCWRKFILFLEIDERDIIWKMCAVLGGAVSFFILELLLHTYSAKFGHGHSHSHGVSWEYYNNYRYV